MDGTCRYLLASFPRISNQSSQAEERKFSRSPRWNVHAQQRKTVHFQCCSLTKALNVGPFLANPLNWKLIASTLRTISANHHQAKVGPWLCPSDLNGLCRPRDVSDAAGILNRIEKPILRVHHQQKEIPQKKGLSNLESEVLKFMESSEKPCSFPTKSELLKAGRADLVDAIIATGGWLIAGWDVELTSTATVQTHASAGTESISSQISRKSVEPHKPLTIDSNRTHEAMLTPAANNQNSNSLLSGFIGPEMSQPVTARLQGGEALNLSNRGLEAQVRASTGELGNSADLKRGWEEVSKLFGMSSSKRKPEHDRKTAKEQYPRNIKEGAYTTSVPKANNFVASDSPSPHLLKSGPDSFFMKRDIPLPKQNYVLGNFTQGENQSMNLVSQAKNRKKKRKHIESKSEDRKMNQALNRINEKVTRRKDWIAMLESNSHERFFDKQEEDDPASISSLIGGLESELTTTLNMLQTGKRLLAHDDSMKQMDDSPLSEIEKASDALEFCETDLMRKRADLRTKRAQLAALKGKLAFDLMEAKKEVEKKDERLTRARNILKTMCTVRIVWAIPASEVFLTGSFDGWTSQIKLQRSNAGVFVTALQLYPGRYEIKFIVDGMWRVDPDRPIIHHDGFENNILTILHQHN